MRAGKFSLLQTMNQMLAPGSGDLVRDTQANVSASGGIIET